MFKILVFSFILTGLFLFPASAKDSPETLLAKLPAEIGAFKLSGNVEVYDEKAMGASLGYDNFDAGTSLTIYLYDLGQTDIADGIDSLVITQAKDEAIKEVEAVASEYGLYKDVKVLTDEKSEIAADGGSAVKILRTCFTYEMVNPDNGESMGWQDSYMYVTGLKGYVCKFRATGPRGTDEGGIKRVVKGVLAALVK